MGRWTPVVLLLFAAASSLCAAPFAGELTDSLPARTGSVFFFDLEKIRSVPFLRKIPGMELLTRTGPDQPVLPGSAELKKAAFFFAEKDSALLLQTSVDEAGFRTYLRKNDSGDSRIRETAAPSGQVLFQFDGPEIPLPGMPRREESAAMTFSRNGIMLLSSESAVRRISAMPSGPPLALRSLLAMLPDDSALAGVLFPEDGHAACPETLWDGAEKIVFGFSFRPGEPFPCSGTVLVFPKAGREVRVQQNVRKYVEEAYAAGRSKGPVRPEMLFAFRVSPAPGFTRIDISLTEQDGIDFFTLIFQHLK